MKKFIAVIVACLTCSGIYAQRAYEGANLGDNWGQRNNLRDSIFKHII